MILNGWKEIAGHLGRGVRTVQRWEQLGLPVRRPNSRLRSAVICTTEELDAWVARCESGRPTVQETRAPGLELIDPQRVLELAAKAARLQRNAALLMQTVGEINARAEARSKRAQVRSASQ